MKQLFYLIFYSSNSYCHSNLVKIVAMSLCWTFWQAHTVHFNDQYIVKRRLVLVLRVGSSLINVEVDLWIMVHILCFLLIWLSTLLVLTNITPKSSFFSKYFIIVLVTCILALMSDKTKIYSYLFTDSFAASSSITLVNSLHIKRLITSPIPSRLAPKKFFQCY